MSSVTGAADGPNDGERTAPIWRGQAVGATPRLRTEFVEVRAARYASGSVSSLPSSTCSRCASPVTTPFCGQCGLRAGAPDRSRRAVIAGVIGIGAAAGLGTWGIARGSGGTKKPARGASWESDWLSGVAGLREATQQQKTTSKPMLVYFYATWCGYCRRLDANVLAQDAAREALEDVIKVRINAEESRETQQLAGELGVRGYPTLMLVSPEGSIRRIRTPQTIDELRAILG